MIKGQRLCSPNKKKENNEESKKRKSKNCSTVPHVWICVWLAVTHVLRCKEYISEMHSRNAV